MTSLARLRDLYKGVLIFIVNIKDQFCSHHGDKERAPLYCPTWLSGDTGRGSQEGLGGD